MNSYIQKLMSIAECISWAEINANNGSAGTRLPKGFWLLLEAQNTSELEQAFYSFDNHVVVQGSLSEAAVFATPCLVHMLSADISESAKECVCEILIEIGLGSASVDSVVSYEWHLDTLRYVVPGNERGFLPLEVACKSVIGAMIPDLARFACNSSDALSQKALRILETVSLFSGTLYSALTVELRDQTDMNPSQRAQIQRFVNML